MPFSRATSALQLRAYGVLFLLGCAGFLWLVQAAYTQQFRQEDDVQLHASRAGLQLPVDADVKIRGMIVGRVKTVTTTEDGVDLTLGIDPSKIGQIPRNVSAEIVPKTVFGEKYVDLVPPAVPAADPLRAGDRIARTRVSMEVEKVLDDVYPLLEAVQPAQLNYTLTAMATALEGRGDEIGQSMVTLDSYLRKVNPRIPVFVDSVRKLGAVSETYREVVPELARLLRNSVETGSTFVSEETKLRALFEDVAGFATTSRDFLEANGDNIIRLSDLSQQQLPLFARYAPEYPCLFRGQAAAVPRVDQLFRNHTAHIVFEVLPRQPRGYTAADKVRFDEHRGPFRYCSLIDDGIAGTYGQDHLPPARIFQPVHDGIRGSLGKRVAPGYDVTSGYAGTDAEKKVLKAMLALQMGGSADDIPDIAALLVGPLARGSTVRLVG